MNEEPTKIPRSGSLARKAAGSDTDKVLDTARTRSEMFGELGKKVLAFSSTGGTGAILGQLLSEIAHVPGINGWMTGGAALAFHLAVAVADGVTRALRRIDTVGKKVEVAMAAQASLSITLAGIVSQMSAIVRRMDHGQEVHAKFDARITTVEAEIAAWKEAEEREALIAQASKLGLQLDDDMTIEEMRKAVKRARSQGKMKPFQHRPKTDETAVPPPESFDDELKPER